MAQAQSKENFYKNIAKGKIGEELVMQLLEANEWVVYPPRTKGPHLCDFFASYGKEKVVAVDIKTKPKMRNKNATGFNESHFKQYIKHSKKHKMVFWIFFVDEENREIYGNDLDSLEKPFTDSKGKQFPEIMPVSNGGPVHLWSYESMMHLGYISEDVAKIIKEANK